jgi:predicted secreted protein
VAAVSPFNEDIPLPPETVSHETPFEAVEEAMRTLPSAPTDNTFHPFVVEATIMPPVVVDIWASVFHMVG